MRLGVTSFWVPKAGHSAEEYEDAFAADPERGVFAVADGASETSFAREWAQLLVREFVAEPPAEDGLREWLRPRQAAWAQEHAARPMAWYAEEKARDGAFAALLGVRLNADTGRWHAMAVGDSCVFVVRDQHLAYAAPLSEASQFHNRPLLISSVARANSKVWQAVRVEEGIFRPGDLFLLMTDALAEWFCAEAELDRRPWAALRRLASNEALAACVGFLRSGDALRNDDVTLLCVEVA